MNSSKNLSAFIVDDDPICRELYKQYLINMGFGDISLFDNGQQCINELVRKPDIVLLDHQMEPIDGLETLKKIKRFDPDIYLIFISAQDKMQIAINALKYGAFDYVIKGDNDEARITQVVNKIIEVMDMLRRNNPNKWTRLLSFFSL